jgi:hypothetical protein
MAPNRPLTISEAFLKCNIPLERFIGYRLDCEVCRRPFRSFREEETHCGCCRHLKCGKVNWPLFE